ncbi:hypothetical protein PLEOSDRAFT_1103897 [Pleurotus ostreatus PC15]|uniref:Uncharacterized protein n=1 Tax=Pleurotus ostreatus (strain PC15) TaxID=1137138 RepID=A0A067P204_PLEO1|nr:hypothetical protein PLEOSDRAFT_1103897 [Pleurotus ostreatus PC15]
MDPRSSRASEPSPVQFALIRVISITRSPQALGLPQDLNGTLVVDSSSMPAKKTPLK